MTLHLPAQTAPELQLPPPPTPPPLPRQQLAPRPPVARPAAVGRFALAMSVLGAALGAAALTMALTRPATPPAPAHAAGLPAPVYTDAQVAAAKTKACAAWKLSSDGLIANMHHGNGGPLPDDALGWAYAANLSLAYLSAALWLPKQVDPATPPDLKDAINLFAATAGENAALDINQRGYVDEFTKNLDRLNAARLDIERICE